jgi:hypothetical protein
MVTLHSPDFIVAGQLHDRAEPIGRVLLLDLKPFTNGEP